MYPWCLQDLDNIINDVILCIIYFTHLTKIKKLIFPLIFQLTKNLSLTRLNGNLFKFSHRSGAIGRLGIIN